MVTVGWRLTVARVAVLALCTSLAGAERAWADAARAPHPEPRVIVTVTSLKGGHDRERVQRSAREAWGRIVRCYKDLGQREQGKLALRLEIAAAGKVIATRRLSSTLNSELNACLAQTLRQKSMPKGRSGSTATIEIQLAPGDD